ncbi:MAG TPA: class I SAM-dependent methyltransferase [Methylocella sp.]|nr:class I SAM-dependent methyltransferase [Methylocella sp.]
MAFLANDRQYLFSYIYEDNVWGDSESASGPGSSELATREIRAHLPIIFSKWNIANIIDAPCGDFNWMKFVTLGQNMSYTGLDIVPELVKENNKKYANHKRQFMLSDIRTDPLPKGDILICRDCLLHLSYKDTFMFLRNFIISEIPFLLTSTDKNDTGYQNRDILTGEFRLIDLFAPPYCFPPDVAYRFDDFVPPIPPREMCLWNRTQIIEVVANHRG